MQELFYNLLTASLTFTVSVKGYLRKGATLVALKNYSQAQAAYEKALELHPNHHVSDFEGVLQNTSHSVEEWTFIKLTLDVILINQHN